MIASKRKPTVPCELCVHYRMSSIDDMMMCAKLLRHVTDADGCTMGEYEGETQHD